MGGSLQKVMQGTSVTLTAKLRKECKLTAQELIICLLRWKKGGRGRVGGSGGWCRMEEVEGRLKVGRLDAIPTGGNFFHPGQSW